MDYLTLNLLNENRNIIYYIYYAVFYLFYLRIFKCIISKLNKNMYLIV